LQLKNHLEVWTESQKKSILADDIVTSSETRIFFSSLNSSILAVEESGKSMQWNLRTQQLTQKATRIEPMGGNMILGTAVTDDLESILHLVDSNPAKLWQTSTGKTIASVDLPKIENRPLNMQGRNKGVFFSMKLAAWVIADADGSIHIFDEEMNLKESFGEVLQSTLLLSEMSPNGQYLGFVDTSQRVTIYDLSTRTILTSWNLELDNNPTCISIDNAGTKVAIGDSLGNIQLFSQ
jgi:WD40 repeat protein